MSYTYKSSLLSLVNYVSPLDAGWMITTGKGGSPMGAKPGKPVDWKELRYTYLLSSATLLFYIKTFS